MDIYKVLDELNISYKELEHNAIFTIEDAMRERIPERINGVECKNLFCKNKDHYYLIFIEASKRADLKTLAKLVGESHLSFATPIELKSILDLDLGSVTPLGIISDANNQVKLLIDRELENKKVLVHPNINTKTMSINYEDLIKFIEYTNHSYVLI